MIRLTLVYTARSSEESRKRQRRVKSVLPLDLANYRSSNLISEVQPRICITLHDTVGEFYCDRVDKTLPVRLRFFPNPHELQGGKQTSLQLLELNSCFAVINQQDGAHTTLFHTREKIRKQRTIMSMTWTHILVNMTRKKKKTLLKN